jgi:uncharacterized Zn finger protein
MPEPSIDYSCPHCGQRSTYRLVPEAPSDPAASGPPQEIPSIDLRCLRCGASQSYKLVPDAVRS